MSTKEGQVYILPRTQLVLYETKLVKLPRRLKDKEAAHNLTEFKEIVFEKRKEYFGKTLVILAVVCGIIILLGSRVPHWVCVPFFLFAAIIVFAWFRIGVQYLILRGNGKVVEYRLRDTPAFVSEFIEQLSNNLQGINVTIRRV